jgi:hypothetical protein
VLVGNVVEYELLAQVRRAVRLHYGTGLHGPRAGVARKEPITSGEARGGLGEVCTWNEADGAIQVGLHLNVAGTSAGPYQPCDYVARGICRYVEGWRGKVTIIDGETAPVGKRE